MLIRNKRPYPVEIVATGQRVDAGETVEVDDEVGESLVEQVDAWEAADDNSRPTVEQVKADVGDNPDRARQALAVERESGKPRKSLVSHLEDIVASDEEQS
jgi:hypothetical protein